MQTAENKMHESNSRYHSQMLSMMLSLKKVIVENDPAGLNRWIEFF